MAQSAAPSKLSVNQLNQSPLRKFIHHPIVPSSLDQDSRPRSQARLMACFSSGVSRRVELFFRSPSSSGPIDTRTRRKTRTSSFSSRRRTCRFLPSSSVISSQLFLSPCRSSRAPFAQMFHGIILNRAPASNSCQQIGVRDAVHMHVEFLIQMVGWLG